jgi:ribosomal protein S18 acetylase RimI-like enzyme
MQTQPQQPQPQPQLHLQCTAKRGPHNRWFDAYASKLVCPLFQQAFGTGAYKTHIRGLNIKYVITLHSSSSASDSTTALLAATLVEQKPHGVVKLHGVCVAPDERGCGYGTLLMASIQTLLPRATTQVIELCVDKGRSNTERLRAWYERLGFMLVDDDDDSSSSEFRMRKRVHAAAAAVAVEEEDDDYDDCGVAAA